MSDLVGLALGTLLLRPYVFAFLAAYLVTATGEWGWRRTGAFTGLAGTLAWVSEAASTRTGMPFGLYHYTGVTRGQELYLADVPVFDPLSFTFLAYASLGLARVLLPAAGRLRLALAVGILMAWLDLVIDPLAVRGDRWFLGRIFYYPEPGWYFGVPAVNFAGWALLGSVIAGAWLTVEGRLGGARPAWAARLPHRRLYPVWLYYAVLAFSLAVTAAVAEPALFWAGVAAHAPLAAIVVFCGASTGRSRLRPLTRAGRAGLPA